MARYYFSIIVGKKKPIPDPEGDELPDDTAAERQAESIAREMLMERRRYRPRLELWVFLITDEDGREVGRVPFSKFEGRISN
jgi:hypothetical protein